MILRIVGLIHRVSRVHLGLSAFIFRACSANGTAKDAVQFSRVGSSDAEGIVHFAANKPALAALQRRWRPQKQQRKLPKGLGRWRQRRAPELSPRASGARLGAAER